MRQFGTWALALALSIPTTAQAQPEETAPEYQRLVGAAVAEFNSEQWGEARALFRQAHELSPNARTSRGIGLTSFELGDYVSALRALRAAAADARRPLTPRQRADAERLVERALRFVGVFELEMPERASITVDERPVEREPDGTLVLGLGSHTFVVSRAGRDNERQVVVVQGGERRTLRFGAAALGDPSATESAPDPPATADDPVAPPSSAGDDTALVLFITAGGLAAVAVGTLAVTIDRQLLVSRCETLMSPSDPRGVCTTFGTVEAERNAGVALTVGAGALAGTALLLGLLLPESGDPERVAWTCGIGFDGAACAGRF